MCVIKCFLFSDWSEASSAGTLRSASIISPPTPEPHLPSYLSLACTVNGYSTTTHYDPLRLASRSRDASPHRIESDPHLKPSSYSIQVSFKLFQTYITRLITNEGSRNLCKRSGYDGRITRRLSLSTTPQARPAQHKARGRLQPAIVKL